MKDVIIVGGGLMGLLTTRQLQQAGLNVLLIDQNELGREASWAGNGLISALKPWQVDKNIFPLIQSTQDHFPALCAQLQQETGIDPQYQESGLLIQEADSAEQQAAQAWAKENIVECQLVEAKQINTQLTEKTTQSLYFPETAQVRSPRLLSALKASLRQTNTMLAEHVPVKHLLLEGNQVKGVKLGNTDILAKQVVITTGAWTQQLPELSQLELAIEQQQTLVFRGEPDVLNTAVIYNDSSLVPRNDGRILFTQKTRQKNLQKETTQTMLSQLRDQAIDLMPSLEQVRIRNHWAGINAAYKKPYIQAHDTLDNLYLNVGHGDLGLAMSLGAVEQSVQQILG